MCIKTGKGLGLRGVEVGEASDPDVIDIMVRVVVA
jgi:hypothetical protein